MKAFTKAGWRVARQKGSHVTMIKEGSHIILTIPLHRKLDRGTLRSLIKKAGLSTDEFVKLLR
ncbi:type II toxin-antitoxin system HicA family toxin [Candidatus Pyrohabitans sp.]